MSVDFKPPGSTGPGGGDVVVYQGFSTECDYDGSGNLIYLGFAATGSPVGNPVWQLRKLAYDGSGNLLSILWANGSQAFNSAWTNRGSISYS